MTRKLVILFAVLVLCFYCLISSFLGERGIIANNRLKRQLKQNEYELDRKEVELETLRLQEQELSTEDGIRSAALSLGYAVDSDNVYQLKEKGLEQEEALETVRATEIDNRDDVKLLSWTSILLISFASSFIITFIIWLLRRKKVDSHDSEQEESGNFGNNFNID